MSSKEKKRKLEWLQSQLRQYQQVRPDLHIKYVPPRPGWSAETRQRRKQKKEERDRQMRLTVHSHKLANGKNISYNYPVSRLTRGRKYCVASNGMKPKSLTIRNLVEQEAERTNVGSFWLPQNSSYGTPVEEGL